MNHFLLGFINFINIYNLVKQFFSSPKIIKHVAHLIICNIVILLAAFIMPADIRYYFFMIIQFPLTIFQFIKFHDINNFISSSKQLKYNVKVSDRSFYDTLISSITLSLYMTIMFLVISINSYVIDSCIVESLTFIKYPINFFLLTIYHGLYSYNSLWQLLKFTTSKQIAMHETYWLYFCGYSLIPSIIYYISIFHPLLIPFYNFIIMISINLPYHHKISEIIEKEPSYGKINLSFMSSIIYLLVKLCKIFSSFLKSL